MQPPPAPVVGPKPQPSSPPQGPFRPAPGGGPSDEAVVPPRVHDRLPLPIMQNLQMQVDAGDGTVNTEFVDAFNDYVEECEMVALDESHQAAIVSPKSWTEALRSLLFPGDSHTGPFNPVMDGKLAQLEGVASTASYNHDMEVKSYYDAFSRGDLSRQQYSTQLAASDARWVATIDSYLASSDLPNLNYRAARFIMKTLGTESLYNAGRLRAVKRTVEQAGFQFDFEQPKAVDEAGMLKHNKRLRKQSRWDNQEL